MTTSRARLEVAAIGGISRVRQAHATSPQRWAPSKPDANGHLTVIHQLLGDGVFAGDTHRTAIRVHTRASGTVRAVAATPLRAGTRSAHVTRLTLDPGATLVFAPGAIIPHAGADHTNALVVAAAPDARLLAFQVVTLGRTGRGERAQFTRLRLRTTVKVGADLALAEDITVPPGTPFSDLPFAEHDAYLTAVALGPWPPSTSDWWRELPAARPVIGGASALRTAGVTFRALCPTLGIALEIVTAAIDAAN